MSSSKRPTSARWAVLRRPLGLAALSSGTLLLLLVVVGPLIWGGEAAITDTGSLSSPPSAQHWFGTDAGGRDVLARTLAAAQLSVLLALSCTLIAVVLGTIVGVLPTVLPRRGARFVVGAIGFSIAFPALLLAIVLSLTIGIGAVGAVVAIGLAGAPVFARLVYTLGSSVAGRDFISAARVLGVSRLRVLTRHVLPNIREPLLVNASTVAAGSLTALTGLSYLGLGVQAPDYDWGRLLSEGLSRIYTNPAIALAPVLAIIFAGVTFTLIGETLARFFGVQQAAAYPRREEPLAQSTSRGIAAADNRDEQPVLRVRGLSVAVPTAEGWTYPVRNVSFSIGRGEIVGLVGESGSGKSLTCLAVGALLQRPLRVLAQSVEFHGVQLAQSGEVHADRLPRTVRHTMGTRMPFVFQDPSSSLNPAIKVGPQVGEPAVIHDGVRSGVALERAVEQLRSVHINDPEHRARQYPHEFSGGMRQRAMIAMGLIENPALLVADEPTTALDVTVQREVLRLVQQINLDKGTSVLLVSHDLAVVTGLCTRVMVMYRGEIVENIATSDLVAGRAVHPYTRALLAVVPDEEAAPGSPFTTIEDGAEFGAERAVR